jgi:hypothetical protein
LAKQCSVISPLAKAADPRHPEANPGNGEPGHDDSNEANDADADHSGGYVRAELGVMVLVASVVSTQPAWPQVAYLSLTRQTPKCALLPPGVRLSCGAAGGGLLSAHVLDSPHLDRVGDLAAAYGRHDARR